MRLATWLAFASTLWATQTVLAQTCVENCDTARCDALNTCQSTYEACIVAANGNPDAEAICVQQRDACRATADDAYFACVNSCCGPCSESPCTYNCTYWFGLEWTRCNDQYWACLMNSPNPEACQASFTACVNAAVAAEEACFLGCGTPCATVPALPRSWGGVKQLYKD